MPVQLFSAVRKSSHPQHRLSFYLCLLLVHHLAASMTPASAAKLLLVDLSGTLHVGNQATRGAVEALDWVRARGVAVKFLTNTTKESKRDIFERLVKIGFKVDMSDILTSVSVAIDEVKRRGLKPLLITEPSVEREFNELYPELKQGERDSVVVGLVPDKFNYTVLNEAFRLLHSNPSAPIIAIHKGKYYQTEDGLSLGPGPFVAALEFASAREATVCGKPNQNIFLQALGQYTPQEAIMIGDDVTDDIQDKSQPKAPQLDL
uniref:Haloacid dehalogenase-like hydrolase domain-containing protein 2 n=1 Tax=Cacopsylla melanoneura TaxID=428564 RepID=A0A8D8S343_9HEMI